MLFYGRVNLLHNCVSRCWTNDHDMSVGSFKLETAVKTGLWGGGGGMKTELDLFIENLFVERDSATG